VGNTRAVDPGGHPIDAGTLFSVRPPLPEVGSIRMLVEFAQIVHHVSITTPIGAPDEIGNGGILFRSIFEPRNCPERPRREPLRIPISFEYAIWFLDTAIDPR
jgi:hypothetical protein